MAPTATHTPSEIAWYDLTSGMVAFCARDSFLQNAGERFSDPWRHAGIVVEHEGELGIVGFGRTSSATMLRLEEALKRYGSVGVAIPVDDADAAAVTAWAVAQLDEPRRYPVSAIATSAALSMARTAPDGPLSRLGLHIVVAIAVVHGGALQVLSRRRLRQLCSTFVLAGLASVSDCDGTGRRIVDIDLLSPKEAPRRTGSSRLGRWLARWFATPSDIWRAFPTDRRFTLADPVPMAGRLGREPDSEQQDWPASDDRLAA